LEALPPYQGGGDMIESVSFAGTTYAGLPNKFEAGTPNIAGGIGLGAAVDYLNNIDFRAAAAHEAELLAHCTERLASIPGMRPVGTAAHKASVYSFVMDGTHPHDIGTILDQHGIAIRTGHHCAEPVMRRLGLDATARASFAFYNTHDEVEALAKGLESVVRLFGLS
jgi:cysteine desulfurase/selenocysteine lyase